MTEQTGELKFVEFKVLKEPWNEYKLEDGSTLRVKVVLIGVLKEDDTFSLQTNNVLGIIPNPKYLSLPSPPLKTDEKLETYIEAEDLKILNHTDHWNEYDLPSESAKLSIKGVVVTVSRTSRHDEKGTPVYSTNVQLLLKPKKYKK